MTKEVSVHQATEHVALVEFSRPPNNYFDGALIGAIADAYEQLERDGSCRAIVLCSEGRHFCAGANFAAKNPAEGDLYEQAVRLFAAGLPVVAAVQGAAGGGGPRRPPWGGLPGARPPPPVPAHLPPPG